MWTVDIGGFSSWIFGVWAPRSFEFAPRPSQKWMCLNPSAVSRNASPPLLAFIEMRFHWDMSVPVVSPYQEVTGRRQFWMLGGASKMVASPQQKPFPSLLLIGSQLAAARAERDHHHQWPQETSPSSCRGGGGLSETRAPRALEVMKVKMCLEKNCQAVPQ